MAKGAAPPEDDDLVRAWGNLLALFLVRRDAMFALLAKHELTPPFGLALASLLNGPQRMRDMADHMSCDASYITMVVDRLESLGFAERMPSATDRRVKEIALTAAGRAVADQIRGGMTTPPVEFDRLSRSERATFAELVAKAVPEDLAPNPFNLPGGLGVRRR